MSLVGVEQGPFLLLLGASVREREGGREREFREMYILGFG